MAKPKNAGTQAPVSEHSGPRGVDMKGHLDVSELLSDRAAAPSPFGDDLTFPLPVENLSYRASSRHP
ncbi:MAG TPA: hypothetical protein VN408_03050 [Actinoplanes sp.]|nr:hypothetical protein [Actinoplanes sp.]